MTNKALDEKLAVYRDAYRQLEAVKAERAAITGPLYKKAKATEREFKPRIDAISAEEALARADLVGEAEAAFELGLFGHDDKDKPKARYESQDGSWVQVEKERVTLTVDDWWALLQNDYIRENLVADVIVEFNSVAFAMAEEHKDIPGVQVNRRRSVKISIAKEEATNG